MTDECDALLQIEIPLPKLAKASPKLRKSLFVVLLNTKPHHQNLGRTDSKLWK